MISYANLHFALEKIRDQNLLDERDGPRVLVVGPENAGKTSLVKLLTAYATRSGRQPITVNLDTKEGMLSVPGTLSSAVFSSIIDVEEGWGSSPTNGPSQVPVKLPLVYYYGQANPDDNVQTFKPMVTRLALSVMSKLQEDTEVKEAGCIVDTPGVISQGKGGYEIIQHIVSEFSSKLQAVLYPPGLVGDLFLVNIVIILGSERLYSDMARRFKEQNTGSGEKISVIKLDKSGGCVDRDEEYQRQYRQAQVREYFFGDSRSTLSPHTQQVDFNQLTIYKIAECKFINSQLHPLYSTNETTPASDLLNSLLPGGEADDASSAIFDQVQPSPQMQNSILAIVQADPNDTQENIRDASVIGFIYVAEVDEKRKKVKVLAPLSGRLPHKAMIWGTWPEGVGDLVG